MTDSRSPANSDRGGLFFAGLQDNAHIFVFDLDRRPGVLPGSYLFVGEYATGQDEIAGLEFDRSTGILYSYHNYDWRAHDPIDRLQALSLAAVGDGAVRKFPVMTSWLGPRVENNEGIALAACTERNPLGRRNFFLVTDGSGTGNSVGFYPLFPCRFALPPRLPDPVRRR